MNRRVQFPAHAVCLALALLMLAFAGPASADGESPSEKVQGLIDQLTSKNPETRRQAAVALGQLGDEGKAAVPALIRRVGDRQFARKGPVLAYVDASRLAALAALKKLAPDRVREALEGAVRCPVAQVRIWAVRVLQDMKK
jgi:HEAT repeat protein